MSQEVLDFSAANVRKVEALTRENESLRAELAQMRLLVLQLKTPNQQADGSATTAAGVDGRAAVESLANNETKRGILGGKTRKARVALAFNLLATRHAMERLRNTVTEVRDSMDSDYQDGLKMLTERRASVEARIAQERPLVHAIHTAICELVKHGGNQKENDRLFSGTSWGHTRMSLCNAAHDIVNSLHDLVAVAEQQRRAKEVLEVAAIHKDRCLERSNRALVDMARTARDVVGTFTRLAREVHSMAQSGEEVSHVRNLLVTRSLTLPDLDSFLRATTKSSEVSTNAIEKFARHLQDAALAATSLLSSATKAVLEPETVQVPSGNDSPTSRKRRVTIVGEETPGGAAGGGGQSSSSVDDGQTHPGLVKRLRQRWVKSVFERAMLRIRFSKCLKLIHDDFVLNSSTLNAAGSPLLSSSSPQRQHDQQAKQPPSATMFASRSLQAPMPLPSDNATNDHNHTNSSSAAAAVAHWSSSTKPPNKTGSLSNDGVGTVEQRERKQHEEHKKKLLQPAPWCSEDDRRFILHERRSRLRNKIVLGVDATPDAAAAAGGNDSARAAASQNIIFSGQDHRPVMVGPPSHMKPTLLAARRAIAPGSSAVLGKMSPLTGEVEVNRVGEARAAGGSTGAALGVAPQRGRRSQQQQQSPLFAPTTSTSRPTGSRQVVSVSNSARAPVLGNAPITEALREFFVLRD